MNELHLFAGAGGGILAGQLLGHRTVCAVEWEPYAQAVLVARQNDGTFPPFPVWDDVQTFDGRPWRGVVDVVAGGFPCQDISVAGKGAGLDGERSGMWHHMARIIGEVRPRYAFIENSPALIVRGLDRVLADLAALGFDARWGIMGASDVGAPHKRERVWIMANARGGRLYEQGERQMEQPRRAETERATIAMASANAGQCDGTDKALRTRRNAADCGGSAMAYADSLRELQPQRSECDQRGRPCDGCGYVFDHEQLGRYGCPSCEGEDLADSDSDSDSLQRMVAEPQPRKHGRPAGLHRGEGIFPAWPADPADAPESGLGRVVDGVANRANRIKAIGNGQVPRVAAAAWRLLTHNALVRGASDEQTTK